MAIKHALRVSLWVAISHLLIIGLVYSWSCASLMDERCQPKGVPAGSNSLHTTGGNRIRNGSPWLKTISNNSRNASLKSDMISNSSGSPSLSSGMVGNRSESGELVELGGRFVPNVTVATWPWTETNSSCSPLRVPAIGYCDSLAMQCACILILLVATVIDFIMILDVVRECKMKRKLLKGACVERPELATIPYVHV